MERYNSSPKSRRAAEQSTRFDDAQNRPMTLSQDRRGGPGFTRVHQQLSGTYANAPQTKLSSHQALDVPPPHVRTVGAPSPPMDRRQCARYWVFGCNLVFSIVGFGLTAVGAWVRSDYRFRDFLSERYREVAQNQWWNAPTLYIFSYVMIVLGAVMVVVGVFGCCGVIHESKCVLTAYFMFLMSLFVACLSFFIYIWIKRDGIENELGYALDFMVQKYNQGAGIIQETLDSLQQAFRCCGNSGCADFQQIGNDVPRSCDDRCDGCRYRIFKALRDAFTALVVVFAVVILAQLSGMVASLYLCVTVPAGRSWKERYYLAMEHQRYRPPADDQLQLQPHAQQLAGSGTHEKVVIRETSLSHQASPTGYRRQNQNGPPTAAYQNPTMAPPPYTGRVEDRLPPPNQPYQPQPPPSTVSVPLTRQNVRAYAHEQRLASEMKRRM